MESLESYRDWEKTLDNVSTTEAKMSLGLDVNITVFSSYIPDVEKYLFLSIHHEVKDWGEWKKWLWVSWIHSCEMVEQKMKSKPG